MQHLKKNILLMLTIYMSFSIFSVGKACDEDGKAIDPRLSLRPVQNSPLLSGPQPLSTAAPDATTQLLNSSPVRAVTNHRAPTFKEISPPILNIKSNQENAQKLIADYREYLHEMLFL